MPVKSYPLTVGTTRVSDIQPDRDRTALHIFNNSIGAITVYPNTEQGAATGYLIPAGCEKSYYLSSKEDVTGQFHLIGSAASLNARIEEHKEPLKSRGKN